MRQSMQRTGSPATRTIETGEPMEQASRQKALFRRIEEEEQDPCGTACGRGHNRPTQGRRPEQRGPWPDFARLFMCILWNVCAFIRSGFLRSSTFSVVPHLGSLPIVGSCCLVIQKKFPKTQRHILVLRFFRIFSLIFFCRNLFQIAWAKERMCPSTPGRPMWVYRMNGSGAPPVCGICRCLVLQPERRRQLKLSLPAGKTAIPADQNRRNSGLTFAAAFNHRIVTVKDPVLSLTPLSLMPRNRRPYSLGPMRFSFRAPMNLGADSAPLGIADLGDERADTGGVDRVSYILVVVAMSPSGPTSWFLRNVI